MQLRTILNSWITDWFDKMTPEQNAINKLIYQLDEVAIKYECIWGVYRLESLAVGTLAEKVQSQVDKLNDAIMGQDVAAVRDLVAGTIRMYDALEKNAIALGYKPLPPDMWEIKVGSSVYRVCKSMDDVRAAHKPDGSGAKVIALEELINLYENRHLKFYEGIKRQSDKIGSLNDFDFKKGDDIPFA